MDILLGKYGVTINEVESNIIFAEKEVHNCILNVY